MERTLNKISRKLKTNLDKFSFESSYAKLNDSKFNVKQMSRKLTKIKHFRLFSTTTSSSSVPKVAVVERFNCNYSETNYPFKRVHCSKM